MSSILGLPTRGSDVTVLISKVHVHPHCVLVEFWGKFSLERTAEYERLAKDIQSPGDSLQELEGKPGDQCLVQIESIWYRARIVSSNGSKYTVFLIDKGTTCRAITSRLAWGKKEHFQLPPEVEFCVLANVLPLSLENKWSPMALEFLKSLTGKCVSAHVQQVLVLNRTFLLHIPCISKQMYEMGFAKKLSPNIFQDFVLKSVQPHSGAEVFPEIKRLSVGPVEQLRKQEVFMYPELQGGTVETVVVTEVTNPQRIFCQLKVFSQELKKLSDQLTQSCEGRMPNCVIGPDMIGSPCSARGSDGKWYRSILQQVFPTSNMVEVLNVDSGTKEFVKVENVRSLAAEFFRMPVVTYICSLHGVIDKGVGWTTTRIDYLKSLLLYKTMIAKFEYQSISEGVHYVTLYGDDNTNMNILFGSKEGCLLDCEKTLEDYAIRNTAHRQPHPAQQERTPLTPGEVVEEKEGKAVAERVPAEVLLVNSLHVAVVQHVTNPSEFYIQTQNYTKQLNELMDTIYHLYKDSLNKGSVRIPTVGLYCAVKAADGDFYRATVTEVGETQVEVFFVDYGNTEVVDRRNLRILPAEFKKLPRLALKCTLAGVRPKDGRWSQSASAFFRKAVTDKELKVHVLAKYDSGYVVHLTDPKAEGEQQVSTLLCSSGLAEKAGKPGQCKDTMHPAITPPTQYPVASPPCGNKNTGLALQVQNIVGLSQKEGRMATFKEHMFPIGSVLDVNVSFIESPSDFWCQLVYNAGLLKLLMDDIQARYAGSEFQPNVETACVARHPGNGLWYRALAIHKHETAHVDVLFVDYGQTKTVSFQDLRRIGPEFLTLHGQAFRCSLLNPIDPTSAVTEWSEEAVERFKNFVDSAASNFVILKCTIYAVMCSEQKIVSNIVDLETPFEKVTVTCVNNVNQFYCQLEKNADVINDLKMKVSSFCRQLENVKLPAVFGTLCFARYTDGQWYRGQIKATKPALLVHFVDYGDTIEVDKSDLLPVPREANDIMSVPVQAVVCGLSDVPANVSSEVNSWFETTATECKFRALVVAREPDGKVLVELYLGNTQINSKLKKKFQIEMHTEIHENGQRIKSPRLELYTPPQQRQSSADLPSNSITPGMVADVYMSHCNSPLSFYVQCVRDEDHIYSLVEKLNDPNSTPETNRLKNVLPDDLVQAQFADDSSWYRAVVRELHGDAMALIEFVDFGNTAMTPLSKMGRLHEKFLQLPMYSTHCMLSDAAGLGEQVVVDPDVVSAFKEKISSSGEKVFKCQFVRKIGSVWEVNLEDNGVKVTYKVHCSPHNFLEDLFEGQKLEAYITVINDDQTFWCQSASSEEHDEILLGLSEVENSAGQNHIDPDALVPGSLCIARFLDDELWYRAEVIDKNEGELSVFFLDYGNKARVSITDVREMPPCLLKIPPQAFLCELEGFDVLCGYWESGAKVELSALIDVKLLQLTVTKLARATGTIFVQVECEGQVINELMKTWWKSFITENKAKADEPPDSDEASVQTDSSVNESVVSDDQVENPKTQEADKSHIHFEKDNSDELSTDQFEPCTEDEVQKLSTPKSSKDSVHLEIFGIQEERQIKDRFPGDSGIDESILSPLDDKDQNVLTVNFNMEDTNKEPEEEQVLVMDPLGPNVSSSPVDENLLETTDDHERTANTDKESLLEEMNTVSYSSDIMNVSGKKELNFSF
uniref:Tudor domain containing 6 n=1 Tax=Neolamprologus brichardi TaxID=32507 RepID=A0A3Q4HSF7_NEOBR